MLCSKLNPIATSPSALPIIGGGSIISRFPNVENSRLGNDAEWSVLVLDRIGQNYRNNDLAGIVSQFVLISFRTPP